MWKLVVLMLLPLAVGAAETLRFEPAPPAVLWQGEAAKVTGGPPGEGAKVSWRGPGDGTVWNKGKVALSQDGGLLLPGSPGKYALRLMADGSDTPLAEGEVLRHWEAKPVPGVNLLRDGAFGLEQRFNGERMVQGRETILVSAKDKNGRLFYPVAEAWWADYPDSPLVQVDPGGLAVAAPASVYSAPSLLAPGGDYCLGVDVDASVGTGRLELVAADGWGFHGGGLRSGVDIPRGFSGRMTVSLKTPRAMALGARLHCSQGTLKFSRARLEMGTEAKAYAPRPAEVLSLSMEGYPEDVLPAWKAEPGRSWLGGVFAGTGAERTLLISRDAAELPEGEIVVRLARLGVPETRELARFHSSELERGRARRVRFSAVGMPPDAYVIYLDFPAAGLSLDNQFFPLVNIDGKASVSCLASRAALRFAVAPDIPPEKLFGVGNYMLFTSGGWYGGYQLADGVLMGRGLGFVCADECSSFLLAAGGMAGFNSCGPFVYDCAPPNASYANPAYPKAVDFHNPEGRERLRRHALEIGTKQAADPFLAAAKMANETVKIPRCPSVAADRAFREWCRARHGSLDVLNQRWGTAFKSWDEVEQVVSAKLVELERSRQKLQGEAAVAWTAATGGVTPEMKARMDKHPGWAMDWLRWENQSALALYQLFRDTARSVNPRTLYSNNLCWPSFWPQFFMPFIRGMDVVMLDVQYTSGMPPGLGSPAEMLDNLSMAESTDPEKPVWGVETYIQPTFPAEFAALQNWGMLAHGVRCDLNFGWRPYSDRGEPKEPRAWEKDPKWPMWMVIDTDNTRLPAYYTLERSAREINAYHKRFDGLAVKRAPTPVALYVSPDTGLLVNCETGNKPWGSVWFRNRAALHFALRFQGVSTDYVDDLTLPASPGKYRFLIVPASKALSPEAAEKIASFARSGGVVVLAGPSGMVDPWLKPYANLGGEAWGDLAWRAPDFKADFSPARFVASTDKGPEGKLASESPGSKGGELDGAVPDSKTLRGVGVGVVAGAEPVKDALGAVVGWRRPWGKGSLLAYGVFPDTYSGDCHVPANIAAWATQLRTLAGLPREGWWETTAGVGQGGAGKGAPAVEVVTRWKSPDEKFVFVLNQGGEGEGDLCLDLGPGRWTAEDVLAGRPLGESGADGKLRLPLGLKPFGYRVLRLIRE